MEVVIPQAPELWGGYFKFLDLAKKSALAYSNPVSVLEPFSCAAVDEFRKLLRDDNIIPPEHPNPPWFEPWCFEQWLLLDDWMESTKRDVVFKMDSDCLVFSNLQQVWESLGKPAMSWPIQTSFVTRQWARKMADFTLDAFRKPGKVEREVVLLNQLAWDGGAIDLLGHKEHALDDNLMHTRLELEYEGHKDIWFVQGQPCWIRPNGYTRLAMLHCWGKAKDKMDSIWRQSRESIGADPVRLKLDDCRRDNL